MSQQLRVGFISIPNYVDYRDDPIPRFEGIFSPVVQTFNDWMVTPLFNRTLVPVVSFLIHSFSTTIMLNIIFQESFGQFDNQSGNYSGLLGMLQQNVRLLHMYPCLSVNHLNYDNHEIHVTGGGHDVWSKQ